MRHIINPAFHPLGLGYVVFSPIGYTSFQVGVNTITLGDIFKNENGNLVSTLYPSFQRESLNKMFRLHTLIDLEFTTNLWGFGFKHKGKGFIYVGMNERAEMGIRLPKNLFDFALNGGADNAHGLISLDFKNLDARLSLYTELYGGYSYKISDKWTIGGKAKFLIGQAHAKLKNDNLMLDVLEYDWWLRGSSVIDVSAPVNKQKLPEKINYDDLAIYDYSGLIGGQSISDYIKPQGYGAALDIGAVVNPYKNLRIAFSLTDIGFICWKEGTRYALSVDTAFTDVRHARFGDYYQYDNETHTTTLDFDKLFNDTLRETLIDLTNSLHTNKKTGFWSMVSPKFIFGIDYTFCRGILNIGVVSKTRYFSHHLYQEVTVGGGVRPCKWVNLALSYSLVQNGRYSNIGAGLSVIPYDGLNMTLAMDYIPLRYYNLSGTRIPTTVGNINFLMGISITWQSYVKKNENLKSNTKSGKKWSCRCEG